MYKIPKTNYSVEEIRNKMQRSTRSDGSNEEDIEQLRIRIEAFVDSLSLETIRMVLLYIKSGMH